MRSMSAVTFYLHPNARVGSIFNFFLENLNSFPFNKYKYVIHVRVHLVVVVIVRLVVVVVRLVVVIVRLVVVRLVVVVVVRLPLSTKTKDIAMTVRYGVCDSYD